jgi:hypothetical protein
MAGAAMTFEVIDCNGSIQHREGAAYGPLAVCYLSRQQGYGVVHRAARVVVYASVTPGQGYSAERCFRCAKLIAASTSPEWHAATSPRELYLEVDRLIRALDLPDLGAPSVYDEGLQQYLGSAGDA